jgi:hypothetical protein
MTFKENRNMKITIIVNLQIEGQHRWLTCSLPRVMFLKSFHRHLFFIECEKVVTETNREIEILEFKRELQDYFKRNYYEESLGMCNFKEMSCEDICLDLMVAYDLEMVSVKEDNENGSRARK